MPKKVGLTKVGIAVAITTAGLLALSPMAFADKEHQTNTQTIDQGEGEANGHNYLSGFAEQPICGENLHDDPHDGVTTIQGSGACSNTMEQHDQVEKQHQWEH